MDIFILMNHYDHEGYGRPLCIWRGRPSLDQLMDISDDCYTEEQAAHLLIAGVFYSNSMVSYELFNMTAEEGKFDA